MSDLAALAEKLIKRCGERGIKLAVAESCTAGRLTAALADAPGAREHVLGGFVVYAKEQKTVVLGISPDLMAKHTAVSRPVAEAMADAIIELCPADLGIAVTGVAGPEPDEDGNPVGLMLVAVALRGADTVSIEHRFAERERDALRERAMTAALALAIELLGRRTRAGGTPALS